MGVALTCCSVQYTRGAGRIARPMDLQTGGPGGDPCWLYTNEFTYGPLEFDKTIYGTEWEMKMCDEVDVLNQVLGYPAEVPAWSAVLYNNKVILPAWLSSTAGREKNEPDTLPPPVLRR